MKSVVIGIDPGEYISGVCLVSEAAIKEAVIIENGEVVPYISRIVGANGMATVVYEDILNPYIMRKSTVITCKFIGALEYRLSEMASVRPIGYERNKVRKWVYDAFPDIVVPKVAAKIAYLDEQGKRLNRKRYLLKDGVTLRQPSFLFVDDRIVISAMKHLWGIPTPKPGKSNPYGLRGHSWQALAVASYWIYKKAAETGNLAPEEV